MDQETNQEFKQVVQTAMKAGQAANEALNIIAEGPQPNPDGPEPVVAKGVYDALYQLGEAVGALTSAVVILAGA